MKLVWHHHTRQENRSLATPHQPLPPLPTGGGQPCFLLLKDHPALMLQSHSSIEERSRLVDCVASLCGGSSCSRCGFIRDQTRAVIGRGGCKLQGTCQTGRGKQTRWSRKKGPCLAWRHFRFCSYSTRSLPRPFQYHLKSWKRKMQKLLR